MSGFSNCGIFWGLQPFPRSRQDPLEAGAEINEEGNAYADTQDIALDLDRG